MVLTFSNKKIKITAKFYDSMVMLEERFTLDNLPKDSDKRPIKYKKLKSGKYSCRCECFIPNGFIYDALCVNDSDTLVKLEEWLKKLVADIASQRGIEIPETQKSEEA